MKNATYMMVGLGLLSASCVGSPAPNDKVASSEAAVQRARSAGSQAPQGRLYLDLAQSELERGKTLIVKGDYDEANAVLQRAEVDADLAVAMSQETQTRAAAEDAKARAQALRSRVGPPSAVGGGPVTPPAEPAPQGPPPGQR